MEQNIISATEDQILANFNENLKKKELLRISKLSDLQDSITEQVEKRLHKHADEFSNRDLIDYFKVFQDTISKGANQDLSNIQITQNQLNIEFSQSDFDQDERKRILAAVKNIISNQSVMNTNEELEIVDE